MPIWTVERNRPGSSASLMAVPAPCPRGRRSPEPGGAGGDDRQLRHGEKPVQNDQGKDDEHFDEHCLLMFGHRDAPGRARLAREAPRILRAGAIRGTAPRRCAAGCGCAGRSRCRSRPRTCPGSRSRSTSPCTSTSRRDGLSSSAQTSSRAGWRVAEDLEHVLQRVAGVDDVLDHQHVAPLDLAAQVLEDPHLAARLGRVAVGRDLEEIDLDRQVELAHQVGDEDERAAQQPDHHQLVGAGEELPRSRAPAPRPARRSPWPRSSRR